MERRHPPARSGPRGQNLVLLAAGGLTSAFALPLISGDRCLAFLWGRAMPGSPAEADQEALVTVGVVAATLLEDALAREELQERVLKSEFIALAAHELRSPVSSIYGISVTLNERDDELEQPERQALQTRFESRRLGCGSWLNSSRPLVSTWRRSVSRLSPFASAPKIEELVRALADARSNTVTIAVPPDLQAVVDPAALDRMLSNLIANSLRHGKPPVTITASGQDRHLRLVSRIAARCAAGVRASPVRPVLAQHASRVAEATAPDSGSRSPRLTLELTEERSSTGLRCRTERDSRS